MLSFIAMEEKQTGNKSNNTTTKNMTKNRQTETYQWHNQALSKCVKRSL